MQNFLLIKFSLDRKFDDFIQSNVSDFNNIGLEIDDPVEKKELLSELPEWEITDIEIKDDGVINYGLYFEDNEDGKSELQRFKKFLEDNLKDLSFEILNIDNSNWEDEWKKSYTSFEIGNKILIKPSWEEKPKTDKIVIEIDPKMAFGTGTHETTSMCMEYVENYDFTDKNILDIGCGSGILSILSKKLGANNVDACDIDKIAVDSTLDNAKINNVEINAFESDLFSNVKVKYDIIFANILAEIIARMLPDADNYLNEDGILILSGIINERENYVLDHLRINNFEIIEIKRKNEWSLISARRRDA